MPASIWSPTGTLTAANLLYTYPLLEATTRTVASKLDDWLSFKDKDLDPTGAESCTDKLQYLLTNVPDRTFISLAGGSYKLDGAGCNITNKNYLYFKGPGRIFLSGANLDAVLFKLVGTCDSIIFDGIEFVGEGLTSASAFQNAIYNNSGQTLNKILVINCKFSNLNSAVAYNADTSGSVRNSGAFCNLITDMVGTIGGQGYGLFASKGQNIQFAHNIIERCQRHSIYLARSNQTPGEGNGNIIQSNIIRSHRSVGNSANVRPAIFVVRTYGGYVADNQVIDFWDGGLWVAPDTVDGTAGGDLVIENNQLVGRKNAVPSMSIGEQSNPTSYRLSNISLSGNKFLVDLDIGGNAQELSIFNGLTVKVKNTEIHALNIPNIAYRPVTIGQYAPQGAVDLTDVYVDGLTITGTLDGSGFSPISGIYAFSDVCGIPGGGASRVSVKGLTVPENLLNVSVEYAATRTNNKFTVELQNGGMLGTYVAAATTLSAFGGVNAVNIANAGATNLDNITDGADGQIYRLTFLDSNTTVRHATGNIRLAAGANFAGTARDTLTLQYSANYSQWLQVSSSVNA